MSNDLIKSREDYFDKWWQLAHVAHRECINPFCRLAVHAGGNAVYTANKLRGLGYEVTISLKQGPTWYLDMRVV